jgi:predicted nucleic acid-binding protein
MQQRLLEVFRNAGENSRPYLASSMESLQQNQKAHYTSDELLVEIQSRCARNAGSHPIAQQQAQKHTLFLGNNQAIMKMEMRHREAIAAIQDRIQHNIELGLQALQLSLNAPQEQNKDAVDDDGDDFFIEDAPRAAIIRHK